MSEFPAVGAFAEELKKSQTQLFRRVAIGAAVATILIAFLLAPLSEFLGALGTTALLTLNGAFAGINYGAIHGWTMILFPFVWGLCHTLPVFSRPCILLLRTLAGMKVIFDFYMVNGPDVLSYLLIFEPSASAATPYKNALPALSLFLMTFVTPKAPVSLRKYAMQTSPVNVAVLALFAVACILIGLQHINLLTGRFEAAALLTGMLASAVILGGISVATNALLHPRQNLFSASVVPISAYLVTLSILSASIYFTVISLGYVEWGMRPYLRTWMEGLVAGIYVATFALSLGAISLRLWFAMLAVAYVLLSVDIIAGQAILPAFSVETARIVAGGIAGTSILACLLSAYAPSRDQRRTSFVGMFMICLTGLIVSTVNFDTLETWIATLVTTVLICSLWLHALKRHHLLQWDAPGAWREGSSLGLLWMPFVPLLCMNYWITERINLNGTIFLPLAAIWLTWRYGFYGAVAALIGALPIIVQFNAPFAGSLDTYILVAFLVVITGQRFALLRWLAINSTTRVWVWVLGVLGSLSIVILNDAYMHVGITSLLYPIFFLLGMSSAPLSRLVNILTMVAIASFITYRFNILGPSEIEFGTALNGILVPVLVLWLGRATRTKIWKLQSESDRGRTDDGPIYTFVAWIFDKSAGLFLLIPALGLLEYILPLSLYVVVNDRQISLLDVPFGLTCVIAFSLGCMIQNRRWFGRGLIQRSIDFKSVNFSAISFVLGFIIVWILSPKNSDVAVLSFLTLRAENTIWTLTPFAFFAWGALGYFVSKNSVNLKLTLLNAGPEARQILWNKAMTATEPRPKQKGSSEDIRSLFPPQPRAKPAKRALNALQRRLMDVKPQTDPVFRNYVSGIAQVATAPDEHLKDMPPQYRQFAPWARHLEKSFAQGRVPPWCAHGSERSVVAPALSTNAWRMIWTLAAALAIWFAFVVFDALFVASALWHGG